MGTATIRQNKVDLQVGGGPGPYLWDADSLNEESPADWRSMTLDLLRCRRSFSSSLMWKAASSGVLQDAGDTPLLTCFREGVHRGAGEGVTLILAGAETQTQGPVTAVLSRGQSSRWAVLVVGAHPPNSQNLSLGTPLRSCRQTTGALRP